MERVVVVVLFCFVLFFFLPAFCFFPPRFYFSLFIVSIKVYKKVLKITFIRFGGNFLLHVFFNQFIFLLLL